MLAAGAGRRMGTPKGLLPADGGGSWAARAARTLAGGGCDPVLVAVGASGDRVAATLPPGVGVLPVADWDRGPGAGVAAALQHATALRRAGSAGPDLLVLTLVDLPWVDADLVAEVVGAAGADPARALVRAVDGDRPGHPVALGRAHWPRALEVCADGSGLRALFAAPDLRGHVVRVQHPASVRDADRPGDLPGAVDPGRA